jgi:hypothetical protein
MNGRKFWEPNETRNECGAEMHMGILCRSVIAVECNHLPIGNKKSRT